MKRLGFTLMELLIVLAVIIMVMAVGTPSVVQLLDRSKFRDGVLTLQAELVRTRSRAMKEGTALVFQYRNNTGEYKIYPKSTADAAPDTAPATTAIQILPEAALFMGGATIDSESFRVVPQRNRGTRDGDAVGSLTAPPTREADSFAGLRNPAAPAEETAGWSKPILFFPNGRTSTAVIFLQSRPETGKQTYYSEISFRGMTGSARVSSISVYPPGSPEFPSVLSPQAFARLAAEQAMQIPQGVTP